MTAIRRRRRGPKATKKSRARKTSIATRRGLRPARARGRR